jgi:hypothetical protein
VPDWRRLVEKKLERLDLEAAEIDRISAELAAHLEDSYEHDRDAGVEESGAIANALSEVPDWRELSRRIRRAKRKENEMNHRTKAVWIPGLISLSVASGLLAVLQLWNVRPHIVWMRSGLALMFYLPWLFVLPAFGGIGAYISRRNGGKWHERLTAALLPAAAMVAAFCFAVCFQIATSPVPAYYRINAITLSISIAVWAVIPGLALALGTLPFLGKPRAQAAD